MTFERFDYEKLSAAASQERQLAPKALQMLQQRSVAAEALVGDPVWDTFLSYLQAMLETCTQHRDAVMAQLANPTLVNADQVAQRRIAAIRLNERIDLLKEIIGMPSEIKKTGAIAVERLKVLQEAEALNERA